MNIADLVTQVHGGEEEEEEELQQDATLVANKQDGAHANAQPPPPPLEQDDNAPPPPRHGLCYRLFCCLPCRSQPKNDRKAQNGAGAGGGEGGGGGGGARGANGKAAVPMQSSDRSGANGGALSNPNHSRVDNTPSVSASGVTLQGASNRQQSTVGLNSRDGSGGLVPKQHSIPALQQPTQQQYDSSSLSLQQQQAHQQSILAQQQALLAQPTAPLRDSNNIVTPPPAKYLLGPLSPEDVGRKCLVLDLDETLVHSSFKPIPNADFVINIELESVIHRVYVRKRPGVDHFMRVVAEKFEVVIFTASLSKYADPLLDILDRNRVVKARLFREACVQHYGNYVKDLSHLGRRMEDILIVDNSPFSYMFQNDNAIPITSWFNDKNDRQLWELIPYLDVAAGIDNVQMLVRSRKPAYGSGVGVPPNLLPPGWQPSIQDADVMNAQQRRGQ